MWARAIAITLAAALCAGAACLYDAASTTERARQLAFAASEATSAPERAGYLRDAEDALRASWTQPAAWHAGAAEIHAWTLSMEAELTRRTDLLRESAAGHVRALSLAPMQPIVWIRLASLEPGASPCTPRQCLDHSWAAARALEPAAACERLRLERQLGALPDADPRIAWYLAAGPTDEAAAQCLAFLPPPIVFRVLLARQNEDEN